LRCSTLSDFRIGGFVAQQFTNDRPSLIPQFILVEWPKEW
jgi:hypothetical protein